MNTERFLMVNEAKAVLEEIDKDLTEIKIRCIESPAVTKRVALFEQVGRISEYIETLIAYRDEVNARFEKTPK